MLYLGTLTSLYKSLPPEAVPILENAILKSRLKLYDAAEHVFDNELSSYSHVPVVAFEYAETLLHRYKCFRILAVLAKVHAEQTSEDGDQNDMQRLISLFVGVVKTLTDGKYEHALEQILRLQRDWALKPVDEYTDIQVECIRKYRLACIFLGYSSNFITNDMMLVPKPNSRPVLPLNWQGLTDLRVSLVSQGRFMEALRFSSTERSAATGIEDYQTTCLLLQLSKNYYAQVVNTKDEIPWRIAILGFKIDLGKLFAFLGAKEQAAMWLNNLEKELEDCISLINGSVGTLRASDSLNVLTMEFYRLKMVAKEEPTKARFQQLHSLGQKMQASSHIEAEYSHYLAIEWAEKLFSQEEFEVIRIDIQIRTQKLFEAQGRVSAEATNISDILSTSKLNSAPELARRIELLNEFERRHPGITLPTVKRLVFLMRFRLQTQVGLVGHQDLEAAANSLSRFGNIPSGFDLRRHVSSLDLTEQDLEVKDILDKRDVQDREFSLDYNFSIQREEVAAPILLNKLVSEEAASGFLVESALVQLFGSGEDNTCLKKDTILTLDGKELLKNLVGTSEFPLRAVEWTKRRPILQSWLLDESRKDYRLRQRLWIAIHNSRSAAWGSHYLLKHKRKDFIKTQAPRLIKADCVGEFVKTTSPVWFEVCCEQINAVEERLKLKELKLESDHYEREWWIARSILPQLYTNLFLCCFVPGEEFTEVMIHFFSHAEKIARDQLTHWRSVDNSEYFAQAAIHLANIAQLRIEYGIIKDPDDVGRTVEDTLEVLEEVELLFGTTLYEIDLDQSLDVLNMKSLMGSGIGIWTIGRFAVRLLHLAITGEGNGVPHTDIEKLTGRRIHWLDQLWQWVQRVKARTIAQTMGLDNMVPESMLIEIQRSTHDERASAEKMSTPTRPLNLATPSEDMDIGKRITALKLEEESEPHLEILSEVREILKDSRKVVPDIVVTTIGVSASQDLQRFSVILDKLERPDTAQIEEKGKLEAELLQISQRTNKKPALHRLVAIAQFLNREEVLRNRIAATADRFQHRIELQRLRQEMRKEPILEKMLKIREGRPVSNQDLQKIAATRNGKVVFVDWITITSSGYHVPRLYILLWRNGICKVINLKTDHRVQAKAVDEFFQHKDVYLPDVDPTPFTEMDLENMAPRKEKMLDGDVKPVLNCFELVKPLFEDPLVEPGDLLVLSLTEGFHNFPLHAIQEDEDSEMGPLILNHPVIYVPSLSVLHKCFWTRHAQGLSQKPKDDSGLRSLVLGGITSSESVFQYGGKAVTKIGDTLSAPKTTFVGDEATLNNFLTNIANSDVLHIHLHTNYVTNKSEHGHLSQRDAEDTTFVNSPLDQAIIFNGSGSDNKLNARRIIELQLSKGGHFNLMACASGRQGIHHSGTANLLPNSITDEVMGLVPAFLFSGAGSVTSTLWPITDEHGAIFSNYFFRAFVEAREKRQAQGFSGEGEPGWISLAEIYQKAVLEMRRLYKQPSAWAGFVLSGYWNFQI